MTFMKANRKYIQGDNFDPKVPNGCYIVFLLEAGTVAMSSLLPKSMEKIYGDVGSIILHSFPHLQVSNGAVAMAKTTLEQLLMRCAAPLKDEERAEEIVLAQEKSFHHVTHDLVREVTSPNSTVRKQAMHSLQVLAQVTGKSVTVIMEPHKEVGF